MARGTNQKLKLLYLAKIFFEESDENNKLTLSEIIKKLANYDISADRKTLYLDFEELINFGYDICKERVGRNWYYFLAGRDFEIPELKLLVDSVQSAKFITDKKSKVLIKKLESLVSHSQAKQLNRQVISTGRIKSFNEDIYYNIDAIHEAIIFDRQIQFKYFRWNLDKEMKLRNKGNSYHISPWALVWDDEKYYLIGFDAELNQIKHFRVDKMKKIVIDAEKARDGKSEFEKFNLPKYTNKLFGMFSGDETKVTIEAKNDLVGVLLDRFGKDIIICPSGDDKFRTTVSVALSRQFFGWIFALGEDIKIVAPECVVAKTKLEVERLAKQYL